MWKIVDIFWNKAKMLSSLLQVLPTWPLCRERDRERWIQLATDYRNDGDTQWYGFGKQLNGPTHLQPYSFFGYCRVGLHPVWLYPLSGTCGTTEWIRSLALRYMKCLNQPPNHSTRLDIQKNIGRIRPKWSQGDTRDDIL